MDYLRAGGVELKDKLTVDQISHLLLARCTEMDARRSAALAAIPPPKQVLLPALALLHAYEATHGAGCALAKLRVGPLPKEERSYAMLQLYRKITGDQVTGDQALINRAILLHRRRFCGGDNPSPNMRRTFATWSLVERQSLSRVGGAETMNLGPTDNAWSLLKDPGMNVRGLNVGDTLLSRAYAPDNTERWFQAYIVGFSFRCGNPPILIKFFATEKGEQAQDLLPKPLEVAVRKQQIKFFCRFCSKCPCLCD